MVGKDLGSTDDPVMCKFKTSTPSHHMACLPTIHHPMWHTLSMKISITPLRYSLRTNNLIRHISLKPWGETHEIPHHNLADFEPWLGYATEGQAVGGIPFENTLEGPQFRPQPQPLHFAVGRAPPAMAEKGKADHLKERLRAIEGGEDYAFANLEKLFLIPKHGHSQVQGAGL